VVEIIHAIHAGEISGMYIEGENPAMSDPDVQHAREALAMLDHLVVQDLFVTETAFHADVILPASAFAEKSGSFTNTDRRVQLAREVIKPPGDARQDLWIIQEIAKRMGNLYYNRRTKFGKKLAKQIEIAERYEKEREAAIDRSGLLEARARQWEAAYEIEKLAYEACDIEPQTMAGVLVQARVLAAYTEVEIEIGHYRGRAGQLVGPALAQSLMRLANVRSV
jgi:anaerobic selenocysteine-containing dehydrogenase